MLAIAGATAFEPAPWIMAPLPVEEVRRLPPAGLAVGAARALADVATAQRRASPSIFDAAPRTTPSSALDVTPDVHISLPPPGEDVVARPAVPVTLRPLAIETVNTAEASARGNDGLLMVLQLVAVP